MIGLVLIAVGAILVWAVNTSTSAVSLHTVGWILMGVGLVEALFEITFASRIYSGFFGRDERRLP